jgi:hypothetical protein
MIEIADIESGLSSQDEKVRWNAAVAAGELIAVRPLDVWSIVKKYGSIDNPDLRTAVATCILEHLLEHHFDDFFPLLDREIESGNHLLGETFSQCWKFGQSELPQNSLLWDKLQRNIADSREKKT